MICEAEFLALPGCKSCKGRGWYIKKIETEVDQDTHGGEIGDKISIKCSFCRMHYRRREMFLMNKGFQKALRFYEFSDYQLPDESQKINRTKSERSISDLTRWSKNIKEYLIDFGGFINIYGLMNTGKTIASHILAREAYLQGFLCNIISLADLSVDLSHSIEGTIAKDRDGKIVFDLDDYVGYDILIVDNFELVNDYFERSNIRRALVFKIFRDRLLADKPTIITSQMQLSEMFSDAVREQKGIPYDFPSLITKHYRNVWLHGRFKKESRSGSKQG